MKTGLICLCLLGFIGELVAQAVDRPELCVILGLGGESRFQERFLRQAAEWRRAGEAGGFEVSVLGESTGGRWEEVRAKLEMLRPDGDAPLWLVLIGHGTDDGQTARFCLREEDVAAETFGVELARFTRPVVVAALSSASAAWLPAFSGPGRVVVTASRSSKQRQAPHFPGFFVKRIHDPAADLDGDGQTSVLEAFLTAAGDTSEFFQTEERVQTEHALLDDNGDGQGTGAGAFDGLLPVEAEDAVDGDLARLTALVPSPTEERLSVALRNRRNALEQALATLRRRKGAMEEVAYFAELEAIALQLARLYGRETTE